MSDSIHYRARAEQEYANASAATLDNVRERAERAAKAWEAMADRADLTVAMRERREAERAEAA
ncbi:MAG: hypothetical protein EOP68_06395 [Sphingomonas sp.]|jgi:hypothetical protein|nr:MAG: hypothetical protein EOP68_06395 [Sphingomonas sp.]